MNKLIILAGVALLLGACRPKEKDNISDVSPEISHCLYVDSITVGSASAYAKVMIDYPVADNNPGVNTILRGIAEWLNGNASNSMETNAQGYAARFLDESADTFRDIYNDNDAADIFMPQFELITDIHPVYQSNEISTFLYNSYAYMGGAHGITTVNTLMADNRGTELGWNIIKDSCRDALSLLIRQEIATQYFELENVEELRDHLLVSYNNFPLPSNPPYIMADGVHFIYQQYEIASYADGMPTCTIPFDVILDYLTPSTQKLLQ